MKPGDPARARWERLRPDEQLALAAAVARRRARTLRKSYPEVNGVGAGLRTKAGKLNRRAPVCILFAVRSGGKERFRKKGGRAIPESLAVRLTHRGRRRIFRIPTDVVDMTGDHW